MSMCRGFQLLLGCPGSAFAIAQSTARAGVSREVVLYACHLKPPYMIDADRGVGRYFDVADYLTRRAPGWTFRVEYLPRKRIKAMPDSHQLDGLVLGVHPVWMKDQQRDKYLWTPPLRRGEGVVVSTVRQPIDYQGPRSLVGGRVGLPTGCHYFGIDELAKKGKLFREDVPTEEGNRFKLLVNRIEVTVVSRPTLDDFLLHHPDAAPQLFVAAEPHDRFERFILVPRGFADLHAVLTRILSQIDRDPEWAVVMKRHRWRRPGQSSRPQMAAGPMLRPPQGS